jgi:hypothetical protein
MKNTDMQPLDMLIAFRLYFRELFIHRRYGGAGALFRIAAAGASY